MSINDIENEVKILLYEIKYVNNIDFSENLFSSNFQFTPREVTLFFLRLKKVFNMDLDVLIERVRFMSLENIVNAINEINNND